MKEIEFIVEKLKQALHENSKKKFPGKSMILDCHMRIPEDFTYVCSSCNSSFTGI
jgi:hypothetical protein